MEEPSDPRYLTLAGLLVAGAVLLFLVCRPSDPNTELARTARESVQLARDAQSNTTSAVLWAGRFRLLAVVVGVSVPLVVVYLIWRSSAESELDAAEVMDAAEEYLLAKPHEAAPDRLPSTFAEALPSPKTDGDTD